MGSTDEKEEYTYENEEREELTEERILQMLDERKFKELKEELEHMYPVDLVELMEDFTQKQLVMVFRLLAKEEAAETFTEMDSDMRETLIGGLTDSELEEVMEEMYLDDTVDVLEEMPANVVDRLLMATDEETRQQINQLLQYPEDSAGSVMNVDYIALRKEMTVAESILKIRQVGINKETIYTCYVTEKRKLIGMVDVKELLTTSESKTIEEIMDTNVLYAHTPDDQEEVAQIINKYGLIALPIVDHEMCMVGIVTVDDAMDVLQEEVTEDIEKMAAILPGDKPYLKTGVFETWRARTPWLMMLMLSATFTGMILTHFENSLAAVPILTSYIPMLSGTGGNSGTQASTAVIRALSLGEVRFSDLLRVVWKECRVALICGVCLAAANFVKMMVVDCWLLANPTVTPAVAAVVCCTLVGTVACAKLVGASLPILAEKIGFDPAVMASPFISTIVDALSLLIYFRFATWILGV